MYNLPCWCETYHLLTVLWLNISNQASIDTTLQLQLFSESVSLFFRPVVDTPCSHLPLLSGTQNKRQKSVFCLRSSFVLSDSFTAVEKITNITNSNKTNSNQKKPRRRRSVRPIPISLCLFLPVPSPSSSSHPQLHHAGSLLFLKTSIRVWKGTRLRGWRWDGGGRYVRQRGGEVRGCFCRSFAHSGRCRPDCCPSWGNRAHVTAAGPWMHTCCLSGRSAWDP